VQFLDGEGLECLHQHVHVRHRMARSHAQAHEFTPTTNSQKSVPSALTIYIKTFENLHRESAMMECSLRPLTNSVASAADLVGSERVSDCCSDSSCANLHRSHHITPTPRHANALNIGHRL
jgi:hypothetical protein